MNTLRAAPAILGTLAALSCALVVSCNAAVTPADKDGAAASGVTPILATTVLRAGTQRVAFLLEGETDIVRAPTATVRTTFLDGTAPPETATAKFHLWPYGVRGSYAANLTFAEPGRWRLDIATNGDAEPRKATLDVEVADRSPVADVGELPPLRPNKTLRDVQSLADLTSDPTPDPDLYRLTIPEAVISARPSVIVFATPAFCTSPTCGPQVDTVSELRERHGEAANFIHVEVYDDPAAIQGDLTNAAYAPVVGAWGLTAIPGWLNESWVFVLGRDGRIAQRFEGFAALDELETALRGVL